MRFYKGCLVSTRLPFIEAASKFVFEKIGVDVQDMKDAPCCTDALGLRQINNDSWNRITDDIISKSDGEDITTICGGCSMTLSKKGIDTKNFIEVVMDNIDVAKEKIVNPSNLRLAIFPGCHCEVMCKKKGIDAYDLMSQLVETTGAKPIVTGRNLCCGGGVSGIDDTLSKNIMMESIDSFKDAGADAAVVTCPFCFIQFDMLARYRTYHISELLAHSMGWTVDTEKYHRGK